MTRKIFKRKRRLLTIRATYRRFLRSKGLFMFLIRIAATACAGLLIGLAPASAAPINLTGPQMIRPNVSVEQIYYRNSAAIPGAIIGGIMSGVIGGALGGSCYYNDCGYGDGYYGGGGGYVGGGGGGGYRGGRGGGGHIGGGGRGGGGHAGGGHGRR
jgi:hypothetical protein